MKKAFLTALLLAISATATLSAAPEKKISQPFEYSGYSSKEYDSYAKTTYLVEMSDGVKLAVDVYLPDKGPKRDKFPAVMEFTPYSRAFISAAFKPLEKTKAKNLMGGRGAEIPMPFCFNKLLLERGYALVIADIRGSGASFGHRLDLSPEIGRDGAEIVEWIASQPWSDGSVGMKGGSYMAISSILTAARKPEALKAIFIMVYPFGYQDIYVGGVFNQGFITSYAELLRTMNLNMNKTAGTFPVMPSAPAVDEDGDGELLDEIPIDKNKNGDFLDDYAYPDDPNDPPEYADGNPRDHLYYLATRDHLKNASLNDWISKALFIDSDTARLGLDPSFGSFSGYDISPIARMPEIMSSGIPIYHVGGWFDAQPRSTLTFFSTARQTNPSKLLMIPGSHILMSPFYRHLGVSQDKTLKGVETETLRFFDRYLKGIQNGIDNEPPITLQVMGKGWRSENEWPPARAKNVDFYFSEDNSLSTAQGAAGSDSLKSDFSHDSSFGPRKGNRWLMYIIDEDVPDRSEQDKKCLTYTTAPLESDIEVTGHPVANFWASSSAGNGDFFLYLEDIHPDGRAVLITENPMRAGFAGLKDINKIILRGSAGIEVLPKLPWHGYEQADYADGIFNGGNVVELKFDLMPTSWVFKKGHRIRLSIAASDWPTFRLDPALSPSNKPDAPDNILPTVTIHRDAARPSRITLPVIEDL
jgi:hypothetical protein